MTTAEAIRSPGVQPFRAEENLSPWGWLVVGGVIAGTMAVGAWFLSQSHKFGAVSSTTPMTIGEFTMLEYDDTFTFGELRGAYPRHPKTGFNHHEPADAETPWAQRGYDDGILDFSDWYEKNYPTELAAKKTQQEWVRLYNDVYWPVESRKKL